MIVELHGAGFLNKGAQLMLQVTADALRARGVEQICAEALPGHPLEAYRAHGIAPLFPPARPFRRAGPLELFFTASRVVDRLLPAPMGWVGRREPDALLDISGYAFGDTWGRRRMANLTLRARYYRSKGKPVILMPQMLGPFDKPGMAPAFRQLVHSADLVYARDRISLQAARAVVGDLDKLAQAPDITIFSGVEKAVADGPAYACLVPNRRMLDSGPNQASWRAVYEQRLAAAASAVIDAGLSLKIAIHDTTGDDRSLAEPLLARFPSAELVEERDPLALKALLGGARFVVGSRFHALVGALSGGVPSIAMGWSHKYEMLLEDFGTPECLHRADDAEAELTALVRRLSDAEQNARAREILAERKARMALTNAAMWERVFATLGFPSPV